MIPRFKPTLGWHELLAALLPHSSTAVERFEQAFAKTLGQGHAIAFAYGRSALWAMLKTLGLKGAEVILPAYTCVTVAHAVVLSGNTPVFLDISPDGFNMDLDLLAEAFTERTRMVLPTHLFGSPMDVDRVQTLVRDAEGRFGHRIWVVQDCAHSYDARWQGTPVCRAGDAALFASNIAKYVTSLAGGILTTDNEELADRLRDCRAEHFVRPPALLGWKQRVRCLAAAAAFSRPGYRLTWFLEHHTRLLDAMTRYYDEDLIDLPPDFRRRLAPVEAAVGRLQIGRLSEFQARRRAIAARYQEALADIGHLSIPAPVEGATYSHFPAWLDPQLDRRSYQDVLARRGIDIGHVIEYCVPSMAAYRRRFGEGSYPRADRASRHVVNLPISPGFNERLVNKVIAEVRALDAAMLAGRDRRTRWSREPV